MCRDDAKSVFAEVYDQYFASRIEGCELVSIGPQIDDIHSVKEKISVDSIDRTVKLLMKTLERLC